jgi:hypothetical protein
VAADTHLRLTTAGPCALRSRGPRLPALLWLMLWDSFSKLSTVNIWGWIAVCCGVSCALWGAE